MTDNTNTPPKPVLIQSDLKNLPSALDKLKTFPNWVLWKLVLAKNKWTKVPYQPSGRKASSTDPVTWSTYRSVIDAVDRYDGIGFVIEMTAKSPRSISTSAAI
jgi:primase-polymerase (primpol)-like protein